MTLDVQSSKVASRYKWIALTNTTIGVLMVTISGSITLISLPDIFRGIHLNPLAPGNTSYFLWLLMGFLLVTAVLVVSFGRIGDMFGRVRMYNLGFAIFTFFSILLSHHLDERYGGRAVADHHAGVPGGRRRLPVRQLQRHPHRRLSSQPAGSGPRDQQRGRHRRVFSRTLDRRHPGADRLAADLPRLRALRAVRHGLGLSEAGGQRRARPGQTRLGRQHHLRRRVSSPC